MVMEVGDRIRIRTDGKDSPARRAQPGEGLERIARSWRGVGGAPGLPLLYQVLYSSMEDCDAQSSHVREETANWSVR